MFKTGVVYGNFKTRFRFVDQGPIKSSPNSYKKKLFEDLKSFKGKLEGIKAAKEKRKERLKSTTFIDPLVEQ
jgi:hypothetical protein